MGLLKGILGLVDDIVSIPTDIIGITNHYNKKEARRYVQRKFLSGEISSSEYEKLLLIIENK